MCVCVEWTHTLITRLTSQETNCGRCPLTLPHHNCNTYAPRLAVPHSTHQPIRHLVAGTVHQHTTAGQQANLRPCEHEPGRCTLRAPPPPQLMKMKSIISGHKATPVKMNTGLCEVGRNSTPIQRQCFPSQPCPPPATSSLCETSGLTRHRHDRFRGQNFINIK